MRFTGEQIFKNYLKLGIKRVGRKGGIGARDFPNEIEHGVWKTRKYECDFDDKIPNSNWFIVDEFIKLIESLPVEEDKSTVSLRSQIEYIKIELDNMTKNKIVELIGKQSGSDGGDFIKRLRFHQGWWRACVLGVDEGQHPKSKDGTICSTIKNGAVTKGNFLSLFALKAIEDTLSERGEAAKGIIEPNRLYNNLLSSQPLCFNFFGALKYNLELATSFFSKEYPSIQKVTGIFFEFVPTIPNAMEGEIFDSKDNSAFDVAVEFIYENSKKGLICIECKYTEPFSATEYDKPTYKTIYDKSSAFLVGYTELIKKEYNQLFRSDLIAEAALLNKTYDRVFSALFCHQKDENAVKIGNGYQQMLRTGKERFRIITIQSFIEQLQQFPLDWDERELTMMLWARYIGTKLSESVFEFEK